MKLSWMCFFVVVGVLVCGAADRRSFDTDWRFAKFGKFADCIAPQEPGAQSDMVSASSQQPENPASYAIDGNSATRWCAANAQPATLTVDMGRSVTVASMTVTWEKAALYHYAVSTSVDGRTWQALFDKDNGSVKANTETVGRSFRYIRAAVRGSGGAWPSIREWTFADAAGKPVVVQSKNAHEKPYAIAFDDSAWRTLDLPHDWGIESDFLASEPNETGKLPWNAIGWYRKTFSVSQAAQGKRVYIDFDGVMMTPRVYINGELAGEWAYGYASFRVDATPFIKFGEKNVIAVRAENRPLSTRWYPGAGIYRHVWISMDDPVHVAQWGVYVTTPKVEGITPEEKGFTARRATVAASTTVDNTSDAAVEVAVEQLILRTPSAGGVHIQITVPRPATQRVAAGASATFNTTTTVDDFVALWDVEKPELYTMKTTILVAGKPVDTVYTPFGIRTSEWKADGYYLNGRRVYIKGVCQHHDLGPLGSAVNTRAMERQLEILKSFGVNSVRTSHNPPAPELLTLCDKMGILVNNELFDIWKLQKYGKSNGYHVFWDAWWKKDVHNFVCRDRNHPSVICWSAGNEIDEQGNKAVGHSVARELVAEIKSWDATRPVTVGCNDANAWRNGFGDIFDVYGFNYKPKMYPEFEKKYPDKPYVASETASCVSSRGIYLFPEGDDFTAFWRRSFSNSGRHFFGFHVSSYDLYAPGWSSSPDIEFLAQSHSTRCAGEYVWTGFDYIGEPTPWNQDPSIMNNFRNLPPAEQAAKKAELDALLKKGAPSRSSYFGIVDLCGFWKDRTYLYQSQWMPDVPMAHILPHWNWKGLREGKITPVMVYTSGDSAELFLNGKSLGKRTKSKDATLGGGDGKDLHDATIRERFRLTWMDVRYTPGILEVVAYKDGKVWAKDKVETSGPAAKLDVSVDRETLMGDGVDLAYVTIDVRDAKGRFVPTANNLLKFAVSGPVEIAGVCNGDPTDAQSMKKPFIHAFSGKAQVILRAKRDAAGKAKLVITSAGLPTVGVAVKVNKASRTRRGIK